MVEAVTADAVQQPSDDRGGNHDPIQPVISSRAPTAMQK